MIPINEFIRHIEKNGKLAQGKKDVLKYWRGERLTRNQAILGKCYDCMGFYIDGRRDCKMPRCTLYDFMPFRKDKPPGKRALTEEQRERMQALRRKENPGRENNS